MEFSAQQMCTAQRLPRFTIAIGCRHKNAGTFHATSVLSEHFVARTLSAAAVVAAVNLEGNKRFNGQQNTETPNLKKISAKKSSQRAAMPHTCDASVQEVCILF